MKLGIFDSGIGGEAVARELATSFPDAEMILVDDREHLPYGDRTPEDITNLTDAAIQPLIEARCEVIVIACNSATAAAIDTLRARYPHQHFVGLDPMLKPAAAQTKTGVIAVCATPATLNSARYQSLKATYARDVTVIEPDCSGWARIIEDNEVNEDKIKHTINQVCDQGADTIVLACTHYHWIREVIEETVADRGKVLIPSEAIAARIKSLLA